jgi:hypothetical protein
MIRNDLRVVIYLVVFFILGTATFLLKLLIKNEVNQQIDPSEQFSFWSFWTVLTEIRLWRAHRKYYPESLVRVAYAAAYLFCFLWMLFGLNVIP